MNVNQTICAQTRRNIFSQIKNRIFEKHCFENTRGYNETPRLWYKIFAMFLNIGYLKIICSNEIYPNVLCEMLHDKNQIQQLCLAHIVFCGCARVGARDVDLFLQ